MCCVCTYWTLYSSTEIVDLCFIPRDREEKDWCPGDRHNFSFLSPSGSESLLCGRNQFWWQKKSYTIESLRIIDRFQLPADPKVQYENQTNTTSFTFDGGKRVGVCATKEKVYPKNALFHSPWVLRLSCAILFSENSKRNLTLSNPIRRATFHEWGGTKQKRRYVKYERKSISNGHVKTV